jgi:recombinational DNA repair protein (RecF pathway)
MSHDQKEDRLDAFTRGEARILVTKPSIAGYGLNWQHCARMAFVGLSFSYESYYQAVRRCWRFGQKREVHVHVAMADTERAIWDVVARKADDHDEMKREMAAAMKRAVVESRVFETYQPQETGRLPAFLKGV